MTPHFVTTIRRAAGALAPVAVVAAVALTVGAAPAPAAGAQSTDRYVQATEGAKVFNFPDRRGAVVTKLKAGAILRVYGEPQGVGFLEVEVAAGLPVWVYGEYLRSTSTEKVLIVTGSSVNMRPQPQVSVANMPLGVKLVRGDRVEMIRRLDPGAPLESDWIQIHSPQRARGFVLADEIAAVADDGAARTAWKQQTHVLPVAAAAQAPASTPTKAAGTGSTRATTRPVTAGAPVVSDGAAQKLRQADALFDQVTSNPAAREADYGPVVTAYAQVLALAPAGSSTAEIARRRINEAKAHAGIAGLRQDLAQDRAERETRLQRLVAEREAAELERTAHMGRFTSRGWVEVDRMYKQRRYFLRWSGDRVAELHCSGGRYDLALFDGSEIGVIGATLREALPATLDQESELRMIDVASLEVISAGGH